MCGIAGILDLNSGKYLSEGLLHRMAGALGHRGPDNEGVHVDRNVGLAHRRLAIIDPSPAGNQPMLSSDGRIAVCFNGTIFNFMELRDQLESMGYCFTSQCDTEVLVHGWDAWGTMLVHRLNGHFAFVVWDAKKRKLFFVRDRYGVKPLYYANLGGLWLFASEIKGILAHPAYSVEINYDALCEYFTFQNLFRYHTMFKGIHLVPAANVFTIDTQTGDHTRVCYWDYDFSRPDDSITELDAQEEVKRLIVEATKRQMVADVPLGAYLSGGMDSGSIVSVATNMIPRMATFTCGWHMGGVDGVETSFDERAQAELMSNLFGTEHYVQVIGHSDSQYAMPKLIYHLEDLRMGMSYGNYYISRLASKFVKVCLSGAGGDEIFGGYPWRYYRVSRSLGREEFFSNYYAYWQRLVPDEDRDSFFTPAVRRGIGNTDMKDVLTRVFTFNRDLSFDTAEDHVANSLYFEAKTFLHGLLVVGDKLAMANGLEERFPFLDNDLIEFAQKIPVRLKLSKLEEWKQQDENVPSKKNSYFQDHDDGKNVLRKAMSDFLPREILHRRKQGFSSPDGSWYRGPALSYVKQVLYNKNALLTEFIDPAFIKRTMEEHCQRKVNHRLRIWSLLSFEIWLWTFFNKTPSLHALLLDTDNGNGHEFEALPSFIGTGYRAVWT